MGLFRPSASNTDLLPLYATPCHICSSNAKTSKTSLDSVKMRQQCLLRAVVACLLFIFHVAPAGGVVRTISSNQCEATVGTQTKYSACTSAPSHLLKPGNSRFNLTVNPVDYTCGTDNSKELYCTLGLTSCRYCEAKPPNDHPPKYLIDRTSSGSDLTTWWQSITWTRYPQPLHINITLSFDHSYELQDSLNILFNSGRPRIMIIEKSTDFGASWEVLQYYYQNCGTSVSGVPRVVPSAKPDTVICSQQYSQQLPYSGGVVKFAVMEDRYRPFLGKSLTDYSKLYAAFNSSGLNEFLTFTDLRFRLLYPATDGKEMLRNPRDLIKYYYAISDIEILGGCSCNLHAKYCQVQGGETVCNCQHNTEGKNCERCKPLYNQRPWKPGLYLPYPDGTANECIKCQCHDHADSCTYNATRSEGTCNNCYHNTTGLHCENCRKGYYKNETQALNHPNVCLACDCESYGVANNDMSCIEVKTATKQAGQCNCKTLVTGRRCDVCVDQYYGLLLPGMQLGVCKKCQCNTDGTVGRGNVCDKQRGQCPCKPHTDSRDCGQCKDGYFNFPAGRPQQDCQDCLCDAGGAVTRACNNITGVCTCRPHLVSRHCDQTEAGFYSPNMDKNQYQPLSGSCRLDTALLSRDNPFTGRVFSWCSSGQAVQFEDVDGAKLKQPNTTWMYIPVLRYSLNGTQDFGNNTIGIGNSTSGGGNATQLREMARLEVTVKGVSSVGPVCPQKVGQKYTLPITNLTEGAGLAWVYDGNVTLDTRCVYSLTLILNQDGNSTLMMMVDSVVLLPDYRISRLYRIADAVKQQVYGRCVEKLSSLSTRDQVLATAQCKQFDFSVATEVNDGALACNCDSKGSLVAGSCQAYGGQCRCKPGVYGRRCNMCEPGYYNFTSSGCTACNCSRLGSSNMVCNYTTGQCPCRGNVASAGQKNTAAVTDDLQCRACLADYYGYSSGRGCQHCLCNAQGMNRSQCDDSGVCVCKPTIMGQKCDKCKPGYFKFAAIGCTSCNCSKAGSLGHECQAVTGICTCKSGAQGVKCDQCRVGRFNLARINPEGCQKCFCYGHGVQCSSAAGYVTKLISADSVGGMTANTMPQYVKAPSHFTGNFMYSYAQPITIYLRTKEVGSTVSFTKQRPLLLSGNGITVYYKNDNFTVGNNYQRLEILLLEHFWNLNETATPTSYQLYTVLADLKTVYIQNKVGNLTLDIKNVSMVTAEKGMTSGRQTTNQVEQCICTTSRHVTGQSCEKCAEGYQRQSINGSVYETCKACNCNKRAATPVPICEPNSGRCLNCRNGTVGFNCENCAPNVEGGGCNVCRSKFWGLSKEGCKPCNCNNVGSIQDICNKVTGQCPCRPHVVGRRCDQCEDNFFELSRTGCKECDGCYALVKDEVNDLRRMRGNLTNYVTLLQSQDNNTALGPFRLRLDQTLANMKQLIQFLTQATSVEGQVGTRIVQLNATLQHLTDLLQGTAAASLQLSNSSSQSAELLLRQGQQAMKVTQDTVSKTYSLLQGTLAQFTTQIRQLLSSLQSVENNFKAVSSDAEGSVNNTLSIVRKIEQDTRQATLLAQNTLKTSQASLTDHQNTTRRLSQLHQFVSLLDGYNAAATAAVAGVHGNASGLLTQATAVLNNVTNLKAITTNSKALTSRASAVKTQAEALNQQANDGISANQSVVTQVLSAEARTTELTGQVTQVKSQSDVLLTRSQKAHKEASDAKALETKAFQDATKMLEIMRDFNAKATDVEKAANKSLSTVREVSQLSNQAIKAASGLRQSLGKTRLSSQAAKDIATQAYQVAQMEEQALAPVSLKAVHLKSQVQGILNDVNTKAQNVSAVNATQLVPVRQSCDRYEAQVLSLETLCMAGKQRATNVSQAVDNTKKSMDKMLTDLRNVTRLDVKQIEQLRKLLNQTKIQFDNSEMATVIITLKQENQKQQKQIANLKLRRNNLQQQIRKLKDIQEQLKP